MQSVLSVPLIVTRQSFSASFLIRVSRTVTSSGIGRTFTGKEFESFLAFSLQCSAFALCSWSPPGSRDTHQSVPQATICNSGAEVFMSATTWQSSPLNNKWGGGFWGVVDCLPLFVRMAQLISGDYPSQCLFWRIAYLNRHESKHTHTLTLRV